MSKENAQDGELVRFVKSYREPVAIAEVAGELATLGKVGSQWKKASKTEWTRELRKLIADGFLIEVDKLLSVPSPLREVAPPIAKTPHVQGALFGSDSFSEVFKS